MPGEPVQTIGSLPPPLETAVEQAAGRGNDPGRCGFELSRNIVLAVREAKTLRPDLSVKYGCYLLHNHSKRLGNEVWAMYEQVCVALLQYGKYSKQVSEVDSDDMRLAQEYCTILSAQFPDSLRVKRLEGMMWEAKGEFDMAMNDYEDILKEDPTNIFAFRRQVALLRARGRPAEAARRLTEHLATFSQDLEAWQLLMDIYLQHQQYRKACFCVEEMVLLNPMAYMYHLRLGETLFTMGQGPQGNTEQVRTARKYFAHSLELKPQHNLRALYGMLLCCASVGKGGKGAKENENLPELIAFCKHSLVEEYKTNSSPAMLRLVESMCEKLLS